MESLKIQAGREKLASVIYTMAVFLLLFVQSVENMRNLLHTPLTCETLWREERNALNLFSRLRTFCARVIFLRATVCSHNVLDLMCSN